MKRTLRFGLLLSLVLANGQAALGSYITPQGSIHDGSQAASACDSGFHFASLWEIHDVAALWYDVTRGQTLADSGQGPPAHDGLPSFAQGWIRTGTDGTIGDDACLGYTTNAPGELGAVASLFEPFSSNQDQQATIWRVQRASCVQTRKVWCVED